LASSIGFSYASAYAADPACVDSDTPQTQRRRATR